MSSRYAAFFLVFSALVSAQVLDPEAFRHHVDFFHRTMPEEVVNAIPDSQAWAWMKANVPFLTCPDPDFEQVYYYRWWAYRKHIKKTPAGYILDEFLLPVGHATDYNAISCALGHHIAEGRWLHDPQYISDYARFWLHSGENGGLQRHLHQFSGWVSAALYGRWLINQDTAFLTAQLDALLLDYTAWEKERGLASGLFWQRDVSDGMEESISGGRRVRNVRPSINSYMYGNARAIAAIARLAGRPGIAREYSAKAATLRQLVQKSLWNPEARFFETVLESGEFAGVRELIGYTPWLFDLPEPAKGYEEAWRQLMDPKGFYAPYGPTTAEQRHPGFKIAESGDDCQWNGPSWPFATTVTLDALANMLNDYKQTAVTREDYFRTLQIYVHSQHRTLEDGTVVPWIDENLNPFTGEWHARARKIKKGTFNGRGDHYNHSAFADLVITGLMGLRPAAGNSFELNPLVPPGTWDWFCLDRVLYHKHLLTILWDKTGEKFAKGRGLIVLADGKGIARSPSLTRLRVSLPR
jgi:hypothetical protein